MFWKAIRGATKSLFMRFFTSKVVLVIFLRNFPLLHWNPTIPNSSFIVSRWFCCIFYVYLKFDWKSVTLYKWHYIGSIPAPSKDHGEHGHAIDNCCLFWLHHLCIEGFHAQSATSYPPSVFAMVSPTSQGAMRGNQSCGPDPHVFQLRVKSQRPELLALLAISSCNQTRAAKISGRLRHPNMRNVIVTTCSGKFPEFPGNLPENSPELPRNFRNSGFCQNFKAEPIPESSFGTCP